MTLWEVFIKGGPIMWLLAACSVIALTVIMERLFSLRKNTVIPMGLIEEVQLLIRMGRLGDIDQLLKRSRSPLCPIILAGVKNAGSSREVVREYMEEAGKREAYTMERYTDLLGIIAAISPMLGFLGTLTSMIASIRTMGPAGNDPCQILAASLAGSLVPTLTGLAISVPVYVFYRILVAHSDNLLIEMEMASERILEYMKGESHEVCSD